MFSSLTPIAPIRSARAANARTRRSYSARALFTATMPPRPLALHRSDMRAAAVQLSIAASRARSIRLASMAATPSTADAPFASVNADEPRGVRQPRDHGRQRARCHGCLSGLGEHTCRPALRGQESRRRSTRPPKRRRPHSSRASARPRSPRCSLPESPRRTTRRSARGPGQ
jgi:hypothetical protein